MSNIKHTKFDELINSEVPVLIDFSAEWCGPCKMLKPILEELKTMVGDNARIVKIDVDRNPGISSHYQIRSVPTMMLFKKGELLWQQSGVMSAHELQGIIQPHY